MTRRVVTTDAGRGVWRHRRPHTETDSQTVPAHAVMLVGGSGRDRIRGSEAEASRGNIGDEEA